jgi:hypothetical protein
MKTKEVLKERLVTPSCLSERSEESRPFAIAQGDKTNNINRAKI